MSKLVIVESPAKAKTIMKYLGSGYDVKASMGHLRDLPAKKIGVDLRKTFDPEYIPIEGKAELIEKLRDAAAKSDAVYLATDPDREGEAISWHLCQLLEMDDKTANRVTFNEITKKAVIDGINNPRHIDMDLVDAQQARRVLDRIVGYKLSPFLWKKIRRGLSAGRVQSVVTRLIVEREREIKAFVPQEYWSLDVNLRKVGERKTFKGKYYGDETGKIELKTEEQTMAIKSEIENAAFVIGKIKKSKKQRQPAAPFITSSMQQEASKKLGMQSKRTMKVAQELYEGIDIDGKGSVGLITYMRTDSLRLSDEAVNAVRDYIKSNFEPEYLSKAPKVFKTKNNAQDAHEAIRPTDVNLTPDMLKDSLGRDQYRLYKLIWERFVACQMANAVYDTVSLEINAGRHIFKASGSTMRFPGFTALYEETVDENDEKGDNVKVPDLSEGEEVKLSSIDPAQHFTQPPPRYNEASMIKTMEELGIGRPSTYAPTISTVMQRDYVEKEGKTLKPTPLAEVVTDLMTAKFSDIVDVKFTAGMEAKLDDIESGKKEWKDIIKDFYKDFSGELKQAEADLKETRLKIEYEDSGEVCEKCGKPMVYKYSKYGKFLGCSGYPDCTNIKQIIDVVEGECPKCGGRMTKRFSKKGRIYFSCENWTDCGFMSWDTPCNEVCPKCGKKLFKHAYRGEKSTKCLNESCDFEIVEAKPEKKTKKEKDLEE